MVLTFVGFSGCGKSHLTHRFVLELQWKAFVCDDLIEEQLFGETPHWQPVATRRLAGWLGQPFSSGFEERQEKYLRAESDVMEAICDAVDRLGPEERVIIDTTGSFIYMEPKVIEAVKKRSKVVYLEMPDSDEELLFEQYLADPKPVVWQDFYQPRENEDKVEALHRCYAELMHVRSELYSKCADVTIPAAFVDRIQLTPQRVLEALGLR